MSASPSAPVPDAVLLETVENGIARLVMNRPEKLNSLNSELATALNQAFDRSEKTNRFVLSCSPERAARSALAEISA